MGKRAKPSELPSLFGAMQDMRCRPPESDWAPLAPERWPDWSGAKRIAFDSETRDPQLFELGQGARRDSYAVGYTVAIEDGPEFYLPIRHGGGGNVDEGQALAYLRHQAARFGGTAVFAKAQYDLAFMRKDGIELRAARIRDVQIAEPLLDEHAFEYGLEALSEKHLGEAKDETLLLAALHAHGAPKSRPKQALWRLHSRFVGPYATKDGNLPLRVLRAQERLIEEQELERVYDLESDLIPLFFEMYWRGVPIDLDRLAQAEDFFRAREDEAVAEIRRQTGVDLTDAVWKADQCSKVLDHIGVKYNHTAKGAPEIQQEWLESLGNQTCDLMVRARSMNKARTTFCRQISDHQVNGRIHPNYNQLKSERDDGGGTKGTVTGRPSMDHPNLLFMPIRDEEIGPLFRKIFVADPGRRWGKHDYSQQEPRMLLHLAHTAAMAGAWKIKGTQRVVDQYHENPRLDCHDRVAKAAGIPRKRAKTIRLGVNYGMGGAKLCHSLKLPTEWKYIERLGKEIEVAGPEGQALIDAFDREEPYIKQFGYWAKDRAIARGYVKDIIGRRFRFPDETWARKASNSMTQGSSASQTKTAMLRVWRELGIVPYLQVYDELDSPVDGEKDMKDIAEIMEHAMPLSVPFITDQHVADSWGDCA